MKMRLIPFSVFILILISVLGGCSADGDYAGADTEYAAPDSLRTTYDLSLYELCGPVKECVKTSYFDVTANGDEYLIDSLGKNVFSSTIRFDADGNYLAKPNEKISRDSAGRITRWEDHRPNVGSNPVGFIKDTLEYRYVNGNHLVSDGMGAYAVIVFDDKHNAVGQYTVPRMGGVHTSAFNVYKKFDHRGNWIERVTIWSTRGYQDSLPDVHYSIDRRDIIYYNEK